MVKPFKTDFNEIFLLLFKFFITLQKLIKLLNRVLLLLGLHLTLFILLNDDFRLKLTLKKARINMQKIHLALIIQIIFIIYLTKESKNFNLYFLFTSEPF
jgi:hypothetical protein